MQFLNKFLILLGLIFCTNACYASEQVVTEKPVNYQIDQVVTTEEGIFLHVDDRWIAAEGVLAMPGSFLLLENGTWISLEKVINCDTYRTWRCRICGYVNPQGITTCLNSKNHPK